MPQENQTGILYEYISGVTQDFIAACQAAGVDLLTQDFTLGDGSSGSTYRYALAGTTDISPEEYLLMAQYDVVYDTRYFSLSTQPHTPMYP